MKNDVLLKAHLWLKVKKNTTLLSDFDNGDGCACVGAESMWEISVPPSQFYYKTKTALF